MMENVTVWEEAKAKLHSIYPDYAWQVYRIFTPTTTIVLFILYRNGISPCYVSDEDTTKELAEGISAVLEIGELLIENYNKALALAV